MAKSKLPIKRKHTPVVWAVALALSLVAAVSLILLAPLIWDISETSKNVIPLLYSGNRQIVTQNTLKYLAGEEKPSVLIRDDNAVWEVKTDVDLFSSSYLGSDGSLTVESDNGDKIIAPGTGREYRFSLKNTGNISLRYTMQLSSLFSLKNHDLPIRIRLRKGGNWIVGNENEWKRPEDMNSVIETDDLEANHSVEYAFDWLWPYEDGEDDNALALNDLNDIIAANTAVEHDVQFRLGITTVSMVTPGALPVDENGNPQCEPLIRWNLFTHLALPLAILLLTVPFLVAAYLPVSVSGNEPSLAGKCLYFDEKKAKIRCDGGYSFRRIPMGRRTVRLGTVSTVIRIRRKHGVKGLVFKTKKDIQILTIGYNIRSIELYLRANEKCLKISETRWKAVDKKGRFYLPPLS